MSLHPVDWKDLSFNPMTKIGREWMLITAGSEKSGFNTMTASWGHMGSLWGGGGGMPTVVIYIRPQRYTKEFVDREPYFTLSFFGPQYRKELAYLGSHSGRDENKVEKAGLTPEFGHDTVWFKQANLVLICRKLYHAPIKPEGFEDPAMADENYPARDFHEMYVGEIVQVLEQS